MKNTQRLIFLPLSLLSIMAIIHNAYLSKETASLHTSSSFLDWFLAVVFAIGIESGLWALIIYRKTKAVQAYAITLFSLNLLYYGRGGDGKLNQIVNLMHPEAWLYVEGILTALIFSALLSGFAWFLTEIAIEHLGEITDGFVTDKHSIISVAHDSSAATDSIPKEINDKRPIASIQEPMIRNASGKTNSEGTVTIRLDSKMCLNCGNSFEPKRRDTLYCSSNCKQANYRKSLKKQVA